MYQSKHKAKRNGLGAVSAVAALLIAVLMTGCGPIAMMKDRPDYKSLELDILNAELFLPELASDYPGKAHTNDLMYSEVKRILEEKKCSDGRKDWEKNCAVVFDGYQYCDPPPVGLHPGKCLPILIDPKKISAKQLSHIEEFLLDLCRYFPNEEPVCSKNGCRRDYSEWFGCLPGTKRERWYSYLLHDPDGNLLMLIDPKTQTVKRF